MIGKNCSKGNGNGKNEREGKKGGRCAPQYLYVKPL